MTSPASQASPLPRWLAPLSAALGSVIIGLFAAQLVLQATAKYGTNFTPDSLHYIAASRSFLAGQGFVENNGSPLQWWPPLYPIVLALGKVLGFQVLDWVRGLNVVLMVALSVTFTALVWRVTRSVLLALAGTLFLTCSEAVLLSFGHVWSEPLFITLLVASVLALSLYWERRTWPWLVGAAAVTALTCLERYPGVVLLAVATLAVFALGRTRRERFVSAALFGGIAFAPLALWMIRTLVLTGSVTGKRAPAIRTAGENFELIIKWGMSPFLDPATKMQNAQSVLQWGLVVVVAIFLWRGKTVLKWEALRQGPVAVSAAFVAGYSAFLVYVATTNLTDINLRIASPTLPFVVLVALAAASLIAPDNPPDRRGVIGWVVNIAVVVAVVWFIRTPVQYTRELAEKWHRKGVPTGYSTSKRSKQPAIQWLLANSDGKIIYSNRPQYALELATNGALSSRRLEPQPDGRRALPASAAKSDSLYVYFPEDSKNSRADAAYVSNGLTLTPVFTSREAEIYRIEAK